MKGEGPGFLWSWFNPPEPTQLWSRRRARDQRFCCWQSSQLARVVWGTAQTPPRRELCCSFKEYLNTTLAVVFAK